jgi:thioredoxin 1
MQTDENHTGQEFEAREPSREEVDAMSGTLLLEFGSPDCGWCRRAQPLIVEALAGHPAVKRLRIADGPGRRLGRSYRVKLWPTLILLQSGAERARLVRPESKDEIIAALTSAAG